MTQVQVLCHHLLSSHDTCSHVQNGNDTTHLNAWCWGPNATMWVMHRLGTQKEWRSTTPLGTVQGMHGRGKLPQYHTLSMGKARRTGKGQCKQLLSLTKYWLSHNKERVFMKQRPKSMNRWQNPPQLLPGSSSNSHCRGPARWPPLPASAQGGFSQVLASWSRCIWQQLGLDHGTTEITASHHASHWYHNLTIFRSSIRNSTEQTPDATLGVILSPVHRKTSTVRKPSSHQHHSSQPEAHSHTFFGDVHFVILFVTATDQKESMVTATTFISSQVHHF
jgi:hypothetical protein